MQTHGCVPLHRRALQGTAMAACFVIASIVVVSGTRVSVMRNGRPARSVVVGGPASQPKTAVAYGKLPLSFEVNRGQTATEVKFLSRGRGYTLFLTGNEAVLALKEPPPVRHQPAVNSTLTFGSELADDAARWFDGTAPGLFGTLGATLARQGGVKSLWDWRATSALPSPARRIAPTDQSSAIVHLALIGANPFAKAVGLDELPGKSNYFVGHDPKKWQANVPTYAKVRYGNIYPGIDLLYHGNAGGQLEYDFVVAPGADSRCIQLGISGTHEASRQNAADTEAKAPNAGLRLPSAIDKRQSSPTPPLRIDPTGDLVVATEAGEIRFHSPVIYQPPEPGIENQKSRGSGWASGASSRKSPIIDRKFVSGRFSLTASNRVGFEISAYDKTQPLIIDPTLAYSTFLGGSGNGQATFADSGAGIAVDTAGNAYVTGSAVSPDFPTTSGAFEVKYAGGVCPFGTPCTDAFVSKLNADGSALVYSTYLGGANDDSGSGIAVDAAGNAFVTGGTSSSDFPATPGAFQATLAGAAGKAFVAKLNAEGSALVYSTYLGGSTTNSTGYPINYSGSGIAVDALGDVYVVGSTSFSDFPTTPGAFETAFDGGISSAFISKLNPAGSALAYSTYLGGGNGYAGSVMCAPGPCPPLRSADIGQAVAIDASGNAYITGSTHSSNFPTTAGAFQTANRVLLCEQIPCLGDAAFVSKLNAAGAALVYSTYLGGSIGPEFSTGDVGYAIAIDAAGNAYVTGRTPSTDFPVTSGALQTTFAPGFSKAVGAFVTKLNAAGSALVYSSYLGPGTIQQGQGIAVDAAGDAFVTGYTDSCDFPTTPDALPTLISETPCVPSEEFSPLAFVTKLNAAGSAPLYSTYLGASNPDRYGQGGTSGAGLAIDAAGSVYVAGSTYSSDFPTTSGAFQTTFGGVQNAFVSKFSFGETGPGVSLTPASLIFPGQAVGTAGATQQITLSNVGSAPLVIDSFHEANNADFNVVEGCGPYGGRLGAGASCHIWVKFNPIQDGTRYGAVKVYDNAPGSPHIVQLKGTGTGSSPVADMEPSLPISFAPQNVGTTSAAKTLVFYNLGNAPMTIASITAGGDFVETNNCPRALAALATCQIVIMFRPTAGGARTGWVAISDNAPGSPQRSLLSGTGVASDSPPKRDPPSPAIVRNGRPRGCIFGELPMCSALSSLDPMDGLLGGNSGLN